MDPNTQIQIDQFLKLPFNVRESLLATTVKPSSRRRPYGSHIVCDVVQTGENIISIACKRLKVTIQELGSSSRKSHLVMGRHIVSYLLRSNKYGVEQIGKILNRDHSTIVYACEHHLERINRKGSNLDLDYQNKYKSIVELLKELK